MKLTEILSLYDLTSDPSKLDGSNQRVTYEVRGIDDVNLTGSMGLTKRGMIRNTVPVNETLNLYDLHDDPDKLPGYRDVVTYKIENIDNSNNFVYFTQAKQGKLVGHLGRENPGVEVISANIRMVKHPESLTDMYPGVISYATRRYLDIVIKGPTPQVMTVIHFVESNQGNSWDEGEGTELKVTKLG